MHYIMKSDVVDCGSGFRLTNSSAVRVAVNQLLVLTKLQAMKVILASLDRIAYGIQTVVCDCAGF